MAKTQRLAFIDVARTLAIIAAFLSHLLKTVEANDVSFQLRLTISVAAPLFVFMFGFMFEYVYVRKGLEGVEVKELRRRLLIRAFQCYVAYALISLCTYLGGYGSLDKMLKSFVFLDNTRFGNILRMYCIILMITPLLLRARMKFGLAPFYILLVLLIFYSSFIQDYQKVDFGVFKNPMNILFGVRLGGPSVLGGMTFFLTGMLVAYGIKISIASNRRQLKLWHIIAGLLITFLVLGYLFIPFRPDLVTKRYVNYFYRARNSPEYYIIGNLASICIIVLLRAVFSKIQLPKLFKYFLPIGLSSLLSYTLGNVILNLVGKQMVGLEFAIWAIPFIIIMAILMAQIHKVPFYDFFEHFLHLRFREAYRSLIDLPTPS